MNALNEAFNKVFKPLLEWRECEQSGNLTADYGSHAFWIFDTKDGIELYQMNFYGDEKPIGVFKTVEAAKLAAENSVSEHP